MMDKKTLSLVLGVVLVLVGLLGFVNNPVLGIFAVNGMHNVVHLLTGALAIYFATAGVKNLALYGKVFAVVYALVTVLGFIMPGSVLGMTVNGADNILHLLLTVVFAYIGFYDVKTRKAA